MTDSKRTSAAPKVPVALPRDGVQQSTMASQEAALHAAVGSKVRIATAAPSQSSVEGTIYVADPTMNLIVLNVAPGQNTAINAATLNAPAGSYRVIPISQITSFQIQAIPPFSSSSTDESTTRPLDPEALQLRLKQEVARLQSAQLKQGPKGTSPADQALFDALSRTMPMRWHGLAMIISDTYIVEKPYLSSNMKLMSGASGDLAWMQRVLEMEKSKVNLKMSKSQMDKLADGAATRGGLRKGG